jgi:hypothetical protein
MRPQIVPFVCIPLLCAAALGLVAVPSLSGLRIVAATARIIDPTLAAPGPLDVGGGYADGSEWQGGGGDNDAGTVWEQGDDDGPQWPGPDGPSDRLSDPAGTAAEAHDGCR